MAEFKRAYLLLKSCTFLSEWLPCVRNFKNVLPSNLGKKMFFTSFYELNNQLLENHGSVFC